MTAKPSATFDDGANWTATYGDLEGETPPNAATPLGTPVKMTCFADSNHAGNLGIPHYRTGIIISLNNTPVIAFSKY